MKGMKFGLVLFLSVPMAYAVTINNVQKLDGKHFFGEWSKFLDQVLQEQKENISPQNEKIYQAFIRRAQELDIPKITGNKKSISGMQNQMKAVRKRIGNEKRVMQDWEQFSESLLNAAQPISAENEEEYKALIRRAKDVGIETTQLDTMKTKMNELKDKFGVAVPPQPEMPAPAVATEKKEETVKEEIATEKEPVITEEPTPAPVHEEKLEPKSAS